MKATTFEWNGVRSYGVLDGEHVADVGSRLTSRYGNFDRIGILSNVVQTDLQAVS